MQRDTLAVAHKYEQEAKEKLRRMNIMAAGLEVAGAKKPQAASEVWYEDTRGGIETQG